ncbi:MAG: hypothetical protein WCI72_04645 [archaeon]
MKLEKIDGIWTSEHGRKLLEETPNFVQSVWNNPDTRKFWFPKDKKIFTKINYHGTTLVEKAGDDEFEIGRYAYIEKEIIEDGLKNVRIARIYLQKEKTLLMEFLESCYDSTIRRNWELNSEAGDSYSELIAREQMDYARDNDGNLIIYDPHCRTAGM